MHDRSAGCPEGARAGSTHPLLRPGSESGRTAVRLACALSVTLAAVACGGQGPPWDGTAEAAESASVPAIRTTRLDHTALADAAHGTVASPGAAPEAVGSPEAERQAGAADGATSQSVEASRRTAIVRAAGRTAPAVVSINIVKTERVRPRSMWESFFLPPGALRRSAGLGSGVIVDPAGIVLTNDHVVHGADRIMVTLPDGRDFPGELAGTDPVTDIAVVRIKGENLPVAPVGTSKGLLIGEWAVAIGNPFGNYFANAEPTVTAGVISAVGRNLVSSGEGQGFYLGMIQTDASINPGNSGGALVNALGEVIGINASIFTTSGGSEGLGFAIPIDRALRIADDLVRYGEVHRAWVGLDVEPEEADIWGRTRGVKVSRVAPGSPADRAALEPGDRLTAANGHRLMAPLDFEAVLLDLRSGDELDLEVEGQRRPVRLRAEALPSVTATRVTALRDMQLITVTPAIQAERGLASSQGALIASISDALSAQLGLQEGDVIVQINNTRVRSAEDAARILRSLRSRTPVRIYFERNGGYVVRQFYWSR